MKQLSTIVLSALLTTLFSCSYLTKKKYDLQQNRTFKDPTEYLEEVRKKKLFVNDEIYYVDSAHFISFFNQFVAKDSTIIYMGCSIDDSTWLKKSEQLLSNGSCKGRLDNEIERIVHLGQPGKEDVESGPSLQNQGLYRISDNRPFERNHPKRMILLCYTYLFGNYYDATYRKIVQMATEAGIEIRVVVLDPVYRLFN